ncbi:MAG: hypothetical protein COA84_05025 [Robiginitomaculum sp.]|nr:MAG: hypothetical protein COA84_05025 [Robiginitomaculum sp.]
MSKFRYGLIALTGATFAAVVCLIIHFQSKPKLERLPDLASFKSMPAKELMSDGEFKYYTQAVENLECELASILLNRAFIRQYPQFDRTKLKRQCLGDKECFYWEASSGVIFDGYAYCKAASGFNMDEYEIRIQRLTPPKFNARFILDDVQYDNYWVEMRDHNIAMLIGLAKRDYILALIKIGELLQRDDVFVQSKEVEYYVLSRACFLDDEACADLVPRLAELKSALPLERATLVEQKVSADPLLDPIFLDALLMTGKL